MLQKTFNIATDLLQLNFHLLTLMEIELALLPIHKSYQHVLQEILQYLPNLGYLNINSLRNKIEGLNSLVGNKFDILCIAESKLDSPFPKSQIVRKGIPFVQSVILETPLSTRYFIYEWWVNCIRS